MRVDHVVIGAGVAGIAARRALRGEVALLDPTPASYKIGESIIPEQFHHPLMSAGLPAVRRCASVAAKIGTTFIGDGQVACFPLRTHAARTMHVYRPDMEAALLEAFGIDVRQEHVLDVDVEARTVRTEAGVYESRGPILDCSGPAMIVASALGEVTDLWPVHAVWAYYDVPEVDDRRFWRTVAERGWRSTFLSIPNGRLMPEHSPGTFPASHSTILTQIRPGTWMWQIPLWHRTRLSVGVVSRGGPVSEEAFRRLVEEHHARCYTLSPRAEGGDSPLDRVHRRSGFARRAHRAATSDYILLGDAFAFADPVYSVGTGLAANKAIRVGLHLSERPWTAEDARTYSEEYDRLLERAFRAFDFWYSGEVMRDDRAATEVQCGFLVGGAFEQGALAAYSSVVVEAGRQTEDWIEPLVQALLGELPGAEEWHVHAIVVPSHGDRVVVTWAGADDVPEGAEAPLVTLEIASPDQEARALRRVEGIRISHRGMTPETPRVLDAVCAAVGPRATEWLALFDALR